MPLPKDMPHVTLPLGSDPEIKIVAVGWIGPQADEGLDAEGLPSVISEGDGKKIQTLRPVLQKFIAKRWVPYMEISECFDTKYLLFIREKE